jgi:hypothetical protein
MISMGRKELLRRHSYGGGEAGFPKALFKNQHRLSNPPPHPNKTSLDDDIYLHNNRADGFYGFSLPGLFSLSN